MPIKVAIIGAGSIGFTRTLVRDILTVPELADTIFAFTDISQHNLDMVTKLCQRDIEANKLPATIQPTLDRRQALADADYVLCTIRQGGLEAFQTDIDIPLKYGVDQCVGDTICAGGIMYAQRTIPALLDFCKDIREVAKPGAILLNYANPMAMNVWACNTYGGVPTIGLCHGVQGAHWQITSVIEHWAKREGLLDLEAKLHRRDVEVIAAGINHQTWFIKVQWRGRDMLPQLLELFEQHPTFPTTEKVRIDVLRRFGYYSTESNGHLSEYLPWYRKRPEEIEQWIDLSSWINGETGGYLRVCTEGRNWFETDFPNWMQEPPTIFTPDKRSEEHGSYIIEALETGRIYRGHFNIPNQHHITNLPDGCTIEIPGYVDKTGVHMPVIGDLPLACAATCSASVRVQEMGMQAAVHGDVTLLKQAMLHDPLVGAVCNPEEVWQMTDEMLVAQARWLPQYQEAIPQAQQRLTELEHSGKRVHLHKTQGAARLHTRTVEEMAQHREAARANAGAADKGNMTR
ncbi:alpha-galactosidase [Ktedonobacter sp. SOSP1-52]|uniref:alpha-glucosidase/alpha-galactosidase n=1 Tax=Ktedonobacter sp. SOSP1-52 TaxID=2778366 RepID=UPI0019163F87|nr:alpha-glucosidase/alpha-galactosidase [Ktedonobacter sp. SOSP1-52]GHO69876.1 alpha-galactosidase [Ktedonobacter sp. SOSP1-52]